jgi:hypothetical protein
MVFKTTCIKSTAAFTLVETLVAAAVSLLVLTSVASFFIFSNRSFAFLANYQELDQRTQFALDRITRELRQVNGLTTFATTNLTFEDYDGNPLTYNYDAAHQQLTRTKAGNVETLLTGCDSLKFSIFQRTPSNNTFLPYPTSNVTNTKVIELTWNCTRSCLTTKANTESMESAKIVIRKK